jgi:hypothetical protein
MFVCNCITSKPRCVKKYNTRTDILACSTNKLASISTFCDKSHDSSILEYKISGSKAMKMVLIPLGSHASFPIYDDIDVIQCCHQ